MAALTLDYSHFTSGTQEQREQFAHALLDSFERTGFAKLKGHPFSAKELKELFTGAQKFFDQPSEAKNEIRNEAGPRPMRGYTPMRVEETSELFHDEHGNNPMDSKEHFDQGPESDKDYPNKWPKAPELSGFRPFMENIYRRLDEVCVTLMKALEVAWGIKDGSLVARCLPSSTDLRLSHYPEIPIEEIQSGRSIRIAPHTDFGPITLLFQDSTGGLEIEDRTNPEPKTFDPLPPSDTTEMIVNVGDTLTRWTNGKIPGGVHQVTTPDTLKGKSSLILPARLSMAHLFKADRNTSVGPLPKFVTPTEPAKYPDITAFEYQTERNGILLHQPAEPVSG